MFRLKKCYKREVSEGGLTISRMFQEGDHFIIRKGSYKSKILQDRVSSNMDGRVIEEGGLRKFQKCYKRGSDALQHFTRGGLTKSTNKYIFFKIFN